MGAVTEAELAEKAKGRRVTLADVEGSIAAEYFFTAADGADGADIQALRQKDPQSALRIHSLEEEGSLEGTDQEKLGLLTFCVLLLQNGFTVVGQSACADPANYNKEIGDRIAREDAVRKIWPFLGYELRSELARDRQAKAQPAAASDLSAVGQFNG